MPDIPADQGIHQPVTDHAVARNDDRAHRGASFLPSKHDRSGCGTGEPLASARAAHQ
jgi:proline racemase